MRRLPLLLIVLVLLAAPVAYWKRNLLMELYRRWAPAALQTDDGRERSTEPAPTAQRSSQLPPPAASGEKQYAPPGTFYVLKRKKVSSGDGVKVVNPGEQVKLLERLPDGRVRVMIENAEFVALKSEVTDDLDLAREAEREYLNAPPPRP